ncbi:MAG: hypothetical protein ACREXY_15935, partial [Gammaproteobacteria bacterium]
QAARCQRPQDARVTVPKPWPAAFSAVYLRRPPFIFVALGFIAPSIHPPREERGDCVKRGRER